MREIDCVYLAGQHAPHPIYEIMGVKGGLAESRLRLKELYAEALGAYRRQDWVTASDLLTAALEIAPEDGPSKVMLGRVASFRAQPPAQDWNGVWRFDQK